MDLDIGFGTGKEPWLLIMTTYPHCGEVVGWGLADSRYGIKLIPDLFNEILLSAPESRDCSSVKPMQGSHSASIRDTATSAVEMLSGHDRVYF